MPFSGCSSCSERAAHNESSIVNKATVYGGTSTLIQSRSHPKVPLGRGFHPDVRFDERDGRLSRAPLRARARLYYQVLEQLKRVERPAAIWRCREDRFSGLVG